MGTPKRILTLVAASLAVFGLSTVPANAGSSNPIRTRFPEQWAASESSGVASKHWALIIGITDYAGSTRDTLGGKRDAQAMKAHLKNLGWREDHILMLTNANATKSMILGGLAWLRSKASSGATVVFGYSGHEMPFRTSADGDDEARDVALHTHDNRYILDGDLSRALGEVSARAMWINLATCRAAGFNDAGMSKPGRVLTFASPEATLAYEDPATDQSVMGRYLVGEGLRRGLGDANGDGHATVEEAFRFAKPRIADYTSLMDPPQRPQMIDRLSGSLSLRPAAPVI